MKRNSSPLPKDNHSKELLTAGQYMWTQYSFFGTPDEISFESEPVEQKISCFETPHPLLFSDGNGTSPASPAFSPMVEAPQTSSGLPFPPSCEISVNGSVLRGSIAVHHGKYLLTDNGETIRELRSMYRISDTTLKRILGNMKTEQKVCILDGELCIIIPNVKKTEQYTKDLARIIERLLLVCRMTLS